MRLMPAIQSALFEHLIVYPALDSLLPRAIDAEGNTLTRPAIYDHPPQDIDAVGLPYVLIGEDTGAPFETDGSVGVEATLTLHTWSHYRGRLEVKRIQREIYNALNRATFPIAGGYLIDLSYEYSDTAIEEDGIIRHGTQRFRLLADSNTV